jgi:hypothetical protein
MRLKILLLSVVFLAGCSRGLGVTGIEAELSAETNPKSNVEHAESVIPVEEKSIPTSSLPNLGPAPEVDNEIWLNIDQPLSLADLRGQVVLLEMWTFG